MKSLLLSIILVFVFDVFNIFQRDKFKNIRDEKGQISIAVMPFQNMTRDSIWDIWQDGIQDELISQLSNSQELAVRQHQTIVRCLRLVGP